MDLLKSHKRRSRISEFVYILLNIGLATTIFLVAAASLSAGLAVAAVLLSKWRAFAVRPRFWFANIVANMVDIIVGLSVVTLLYAANGAIWLQAVMTLFYIVWLLVIKPRSKRSFVVLQAGIAVFLGITALSMISYEWDSSFFVVCMWAIGFSAARHVLGSYEETLTNQYALVTGLLYAELGWVGYHWLFAYTVPGFYGVKLSQLGLIMTTLSFVVVRGYQSYHKHKTIMAKDVLMPAFFSAALLIALLFFYNSLNSGSI